ncbi:LysR family transcriptional regulator [Vagococcus hydrophili]|uniref:LysR family transcriptional regulator n=1 Tax=Vagococcus hydrophili TaxID=2714947 RepID=A0A6G8AXC3_9ENTE|nr:LysR family transcriptional regulator [Vagococcus hydrophili]QIL49646.1 LysR family transcriptional regulator [Vagococcus hydrophili]
MDIKQLRYFVTIVDNNFNLSRAAELLYVSQPTLSMMINDFEKREELKLFKRAGGRIKGLTYAGESFYEDAMIVLQNYNDMFTNLHEQFKGMKGTITIGIPPLVLSVVFSTVMPRLILENPEIKFNIKEIGAYDLKNELLLGNVDIAVLLSPTGLADNLIENYEIQRSELSLFVSPSHKLAKRQKVGWSDLDNEKLAIFDSSFMINHLLMDQFERHQVHPNIILTSGSWDFMLNSTKINHDIATILPKPTKDLYQVTDVVCLPMEKPISWQVVLARLRKDNYSKIEAYIIESLTQAFNGK